ncbi:MAG: ATP-binding cassette domain-containing protein [Ruminococcaceae bacterium]|nr:ATP-binding cassette domain-containing protein [Oscillospiraceae bacterium]
MIEIKNLTKKYGNKTVLDNISFTVNSGEILGFLGPNGAGKSTTMNIITGYIASTSGSVSIDGIDIMDDAKAYKKKIGYLPEIPPLYLDMTVREYLEFVCGIKDADTSCIEKILEEVRILDVKDRLIKNLSKGYRQRVGIAQALVGDPELLILDEPTVGLDPMQIIDIRNVISELGKKKTLFISSHILSEINAVCDRVLIINKGKIIAEDTPENLASLVSGKNKYLASIEGDKEKINSCLSSLSGIEKFECKGEGEKGSYDYIIYAKNGMDIRRELFKAVASLDMVMLSFKSYDVSLEDIFITLTNEKGGEEQ